MLLFDDYYYELIKKCFCEISFSHYLCRSDSLRLLLGWQKICAILHLLQKFLRKLVVKNEAKHICVDYNKRK